MKYFFFFIITALLSACGTTSTVKIPTTAPANPSFVLIDERQADKKLSRTENSNSAIVSIIGDDNLEPQATDIITARLSERLGPGLKGRTIRLTDFEIRIVEPTVKVDPDRFNTAVASTPGGYAAAPLAALFIFGIEKTKSEKTVLIKIDGKLDQHEFSVAGSDHYQGRVTEANVRSTLETVLDRLTEKVEKMLRENVGP